MALDGCFLRYIKSEIEQKALGARVEKIYMPSRDELVFHLRGRAGSLKLLMSANVNSARVGFTGESIENPQSPPMLCMLFRKHLGSAILEGVRQQGLERALMFDFRAYNELQDRIQLTLIAEVMGRHSNIILVDGQGKIIDSIKRVDISAPSVRPVLPGITYQPPPSQNKLSLLNSDVDTILAALEEQRDSELPKALLSVLQGVSPVVCRELAFLAAGDTNISFRVLQPEQKKRLAYHIQRLSSNLKEGRANYTAVFDLEGKPIDFSFMDITQYGGLAKVKHFESASSLLHAFFSQRDARERMYRKSQDLFKVLNNARDRIIRKLSAQQVELEQCKKGEQMRLYGDLINANLYKIQKGELYADLENYFEHSPTILRIPLDPTLTPAQNAQRYYKKYRKATTAEKMLKIQIEKGKSEIQYIDSVLDLLSRAQTERELNEIRAELAQSGYIRPLSSRQKQPLPLPPHKFISSDGFTILVGRNNRQNDDLTLRYAKKSDIWLHTKNIPGSHTVILTNGATPPDRTIRQAAMLAAYHSKARLSANVPVDYTLIKYVSKPKGAKPGMVIYKNNSTIFVTPDSSLPGQLMAKD